jgi:hypothetical protein
MLIFQMNLTSNSMKSFSSVHVLLIKDEQPDRYDKAKNGIFLKNSNRCKIRVYTFIKEYIGS